MTEVNVLIISTVADVATDAVVRALSDRGIPHRRINTEDFPFSKALTIDFQSHTDDVALTFDRKVTTPIAVWYRRIRSPACPKAMDADIYDFCLRENRAAFLGGLLTQRVRWMSDPTSVWRAEFKPYQLRIAQDAGLRIPKTIVSNDPAAIRQAFHDFGSLIVKPARSGHFRQNGLEYSIFTSKITEDHLNSLEEAKWTPSIYQELVGKQYDIRVTFVGSKLFAAAIHSQNDPAAVVDWRKTDNPLLPHSVIELPPTLVLQLQQFMKRMDLHFGCIDLVLTPSGDYVFLEVNPSGQWLWLDDQLNLGISSAVAQWLADKGAE